MSSIYHCNGTIDYILFEFSITMNSIETTFTVDLSTMGATFGNTYFVAPEGSDLTGQRGNITLPFQTITGARDKVVGEISASTVTGTTLVYVFPGDYVGDELQYDNGNFYFSPGAKVTSTPRLNANVTSMFVIGGTPLYVSSAYSANVCNVFGSGEFVLSESIDVSPDWGGTIVNVTSSGITYFECYKFHVEQGVGVGVVDSGQATFVGKFLTVDAGYVATVRDYGDAVFNFNRISTEGNGYPFFIRYGSSGGFFGKCVVNSEVISVGSLGGYQAVLIQRLRDGAEVIINSDKITSAASYAIYASQCTGGDVTINGKLFGVRGLLSQASSGGNFYINADIEATEGGIDMFSNNTDNHTVIYDGNINVLSGATDGIDLVGGTLKLHGSLTNKDISGTGTTYNGIAKSGGILEIDNFSVFTDNESIVGSGNVTINRTLYIDKPIGGTVTTTGQYIFTGTTYDGDLNIYNTPTNDNSLTEILGRNSTTGDVEYRDVSSIIGAASADTFVTDFTYDNINTFTISDNSGSTFNASINVLSATTISATTYFGDGSNLSGISTDNFYVTGGTYNEPTKEINFTGNSVQTTFDVDLTSLISSVSGDTYVISGNANAGTSELTFTNNSGSTFTVSNSAALFSDNDINVTGGTYNPNNGCVTFGTNSGTTFDVCGFLTGFTNTFSTGGTVTQSATSGDTTITLQINGNQGFTPYSITGVTDTFVNNFTFSSNTFTITQNDGSSFDSSLETIELGNILSAVTFDINTSGSISATTFNGNTFSGGTFYGDGSNLSGIDNFYVTGGTFSSNTLTLNRQNGSVTITGFTSGMTDSYTTSANLSGDTIVFDNNLLGLNYYNVDLLPLLSGKTNNTTFNTYTADTQVILDGKIDFADNVGSANELFKDKSGTTLNFRTLSGGSNTTLTTIGDVVKIDVTVPTDVNSFVTGSTMNGNTLEISRNGGLSTLTTDLSQFIDNFVTGGTMVGNTLVLNRTNALSAVTVDMSQFVNTDTNYFTTGGTYTTGNIFFSGNSVDTSFIVDVSALLDDTNSYVTGGTVSGTDLVLGRNGGLSNVTIDTSAYFDNTDNYVTGATMNVNTLELSRSGGLSNVTVDLSQFVDDTNDGVVSGATMDGNTLELSRTEGLSDVTVDLSQFVDVNTDNFVTGGTYNNDVLTLNRTNGTFNIGLPDAYVTGATMNVNTLEISRNQGLPILSVDLSSISPTGETVDRYVTGATMNGNTLELSRSEGLTDVTVDLSQFIDTDSYVTGSTLNVNTLELGRNGGLSTLTTDLSSLTTVDKFVSGGTYTTGNIFFSGNSSDTSFIVDVSALLDDTNTFVTGFTYNDTNTFTISQNNGTSFTSTINTMTGLTINGESTETTLTVNGQSVFSGTGTDVVQIYGSGSTTPIFRVEGSSGELFSISDSLIGDLFTVNNISGLPILVVNSDNTILWGDNTVPSLNTTVKKSINSGLTEIYSVPVSAYTGGFFDYTVTGAGARAGSITSIFSGTTVQFNETTTNDIGDTSGITFDMNISGGTANLTVSATTNSWEIRTIVRSI